MKEIKLTIPEGCKTVTVKMDGEQVTMEFEPKEEKFEPKDGDIIAFGINPNRLSVGIFHKFNGRSGHESYVVLRSSSEICFNEGDLVINNIRPATEEEKQRLFDALARKGKRWNAKKKQIEDLPRWRANRCETYYSINCFAEICKENETEVLSDNKQYNLGNYFKTREAAEKVSEQIREIFKNSKAE